MESVMAGRIPAPHQRAVPHSRQEPPSQQEAHGPQDSLCPQKPPALQEPPESQEAHGTHRPGSRRWLALSLLCLAQLMLILDVTVVNVALPRIGSGLGLDRGTLTWVLTAYTVTFGGLMLLGGRLADRLGARRVLLAGLVVFVTASLVSGTAMDGTMLTFGRAAQGVGAALVSPSALALVTTMFTGPNATRRSACGPPSAVPGR